MKIGILGSDDVARTLAGGFVKHGHDVMLGTRTPEKLSNWAKQNQGSQIATLSIPGRKNFWLEILGECEP